jgi:hypothetical protein
MNEYTWTRVTSQPGERAYIYVDNGKRPPFIRPTRSFGAKPREAWAVIEHRTSSNGTYFDRTTVRRVEHAEAWYELTKNIYH